MKLLINKIFIISFLFLSCFVLTGCKEKPETIILFNQNPITSDNVLNNSTIFKAGKRIYYVYMTQKELKTEDIRIKIFQRSEKANNRYGAMVYANDFRLKKGEIYFYTDYLVFHTPGTYIMHVYRKDNLWKPDAIADFKVIEN